MCRAGHVPGISTHGHGVGRVRSAAGDHYGEVDKDQVVNGRGWLAKNFIL